MKEKFDEFYERVNGTLEWFDDETFKKYFPELCSEGDWFDLDGTILDEAEIVKAIQHNPALGVEGWKAVMKLWVNLHSLCADFDDEVV